jgi:hypothetical protein
MKPKHLFPLLFIFIFGCDKIDELPTNITYLKPYEFLADSLKAIFPENEDFLVTNPDFFSDAYQRDIVLLKESKVFVTFIDEGASFKNTLCWYSYNKSQPPSQLTEITKNVLFPNISKKDEGGLLEPGYTLQLGLGTFPAGTVISFCLILKGWEDGTINYNNPSHYTDNHFNTGSMQQHILFKKESLGYLVLGFEDISLLDAECDKDFNDILFAISDNNEGYEATSFDLSRVSVK